MNLMAQYENQSTSGKVMGRNIIVSGCLIVDQYFVHQPVSNVLLYVFENHHHCHCFSQFRKFIFMYLHNNSKTPFWSLGSLYCHGENVSCAQWTSVWCTELSKQCLLLSIPLDL